MVKEVVEVESWFPILNWNKLPNFANVHTISSWKRFQDNYYLSNSLKNIRNNVFSNLTGRFEQLNTIFMGRPGCGKTSFLYYLMKKSESDNPEILKNYVFYHFPANRAADRNLEEAALIIQENIKLAFGKLFDACQRDDIYKRVEERKISDKRKITALTDIYKAKKAEFPKILIFLIDDADLLEGREIRNIVREILRHLNVSYIKKWLCLRGPTFREYSDETRRILDPAFPSRVRFPIVSLFEIIKHRIKKTAGSPKPKNPFSQELCNTVLERLYAGSLRNGLPTLQSILTYASPGKFNKSVSEKVIQNYINKSSINAFISLGDLPNLYDPQYRSGHLPLIIDALLANRYTIFEELLYSAVNTATEIRVDRAGIVNKDKTITVRKSDFDFVVEKLINEQLAYRSGKHLKQTLKGSLLADYVSRKHYRTLCEELRYGPPKDHIFWSLIKPYLDHQKILLDLVSWDKLV